MRCSSLDTTRKKGKGGVLTVPIPHATLFEVDILRIHFCMHMTLHYKSRIRTWRIKGNGFVSTEQNSMITHHAILLTTDRYYYRLFQASQPTFFANLTCLSHQPASNRVEGWSIHRRRPNSWGFERPQLTRYRFRCQRFYACWLEPESTGAKGNHSSLGVQNLSDQALIVASENLILSHRGLMPPCFLITRLWACYLFLYYFLPNRFLLLIAWLPIPLPLAIMTRVGTRF